jgi:GNAT superfamily N-acetyltransferase
METLSLSYETKVFADLKMPELIKLHSLMMNNNDVSSNSKESISHLFNLGMDNGLEHNVTLATSGDDTVGLILWGPSAPCRGVKNNFDLLKKIVDAGFDPEKAYTTRILIVSEKYRGRGVAKELSLTLRRDAVLLGYTAALDFGYMSPSVLEFAKKTRGAAWVDLDETDEGGNQINLLPLV